MALFSTVVRSVSSVSIGEYRAWMQQLVQVSLKNGAGPSGLPVWNLAGAGLRGIQHTIRPKNLDQNQFF